MTTPTSNIITKVLEKHLVDKTYLVGEKVTLADITVASALVYPFKIVISPEYRAKFPNTLRWLTTWVKQPQFKAVVGEDLEGGGGKDDYYDG